MIADQIKATPEPERLLVRPREAREMLGNPSVSFFWGRILPELHSFLHGKARWVEVQSIRDYVARHLAEKPRRFTVPNPPGEPLRRPRRRPRIDPPAPRRGRPRKAAAPTEAATVT